MSQADVQDTLAAHFKKTWEDPLSQRTNANDEDEDSDDSDSEPEPEGGETQVGRDEEDDDGPLYS